MIVSKRPVTLIELIIALSLTMLILSTLSFFYWQVSDINILADKDQQSAFNRLYIQTRLAEILPKATTGKEGDFVFQTGDYADDLVLGGTHYLLFMFDNGIRMDPSFSNAVLGRLYVDQEKKLCLAVWPAPIRWEPDRLPPIKTEVLLENVTGLEFSFYMPPVKDRSKAVGKTKLKQDVMDKLLANIAGGWRNDWPEGADFLPAIIKVNVTEKKGEENRVMVFSYPLVNSPLFVFYDR